MNLKEDWKDAIVFVVLVGGIILGMICTGYNLAKCKKDGSCSNKAMSKNDRAPVGVTIMKSGQMGIDTNGNVGINVGGGIQINP